MSPKPSRRKPSKGGNGWCEDTNASVDYAWSLSGETLTITLVGAETFHPYKRWMLSKSFLREKVPPIKKLPQVDTAWYKAHKIETRFGTTVTQLNIDRRLAVLGNGETIEFNKACLAMGSRPVRPPVAGVGLGNVIYLRTVRDALALREMGASDPAVLLGCAEQAMIETDRPDAAQNGEP